VEKKENANQSPSSSLSEVFVTVLESTAVKIICSPKMIPSPYEVDGKGLTLSSSTARTKKILLIVQFLCRCWCTRQKLIYKRQQAWREKLKSLNAELYLQGSGYLEVSVFIKT
jgi:hypothetical protein